MKLKQNRVRARKVAGKMRSQGADSIWAAPCEKVLTPFLLDPVSPRCERLHSRRQQGAINEIILAGKRPCQFGIDFIMRDRLAEKLLRRRR